jgi:hypothetical protein
MIIRVLPCLSNSSQWIAFCRREQPYCFIEHPDCLVDFQSNYLIITLLNRQVRNGKEAIKYSLGSRQSVEPAWNFIKACRFDLAYMVEGLERLEFEGNARDNSGFPALRGGSIRKFFAKERAVISPAFLGPLEPLTHLPPFWEMHSVCRLLANGQLRELRNDTPGKNTGQQADPAGLLLALVEAPEQWQARQRDERLYIYRDRRAVFSLVPELKPALIRLRQIA